MSGSADSAEHVYLVDGSGYIFRAFFALPPMSRSDGLPTGAVFGFCKMLERLLADSDADYIGLIFDAHRLNFRQEIYADYKANRPDAPEDLVLQFPLFRKACEAFGLVPIELEGYEADDLIASYAREAISEGKRVTILSSDKDLMQIVGGDVDMFDPIKSRRIGEAEVIEKFGVPPSKVVEVQALAGDSSDNIPGVPGIGIKTASQLIIEYGDLRTLLDSAGEIKQPKRRQALLENRELAEISLRLVTLDRDAPLPCSLSDFRRVPIDDERVQEFFREMEFKSLLHRSSTADKPSEASYSCIREMSSLRAWLDLVELEGCFAIDTETTSLSPQLAELVGVSLGLSGGRAIYIPLGHVEPDSVSDSVKSDNGGEDLFGDSPTLSGLDSGLDSGADSVLDSGANSGANSRGKLCAEQLPLQEVLDLLRPILENEAILKIGQNIKYDMAVLQKYGLEIRGYDDTMLMSFTLSAGSFRHGMDELSQRYLDYTPIKYEDITGKGKKQILFSQVDIGTATGYAAEDADITYRLWEILAPRIRSERLWSFYQRIERPLPFIVAMMENNGIKVSRERLQELSVDFSRRLEVLEGQIFVLSGREFNVASPKQLGEILFDELQLEGGKKTKSGTWSTDSNVLEEMSEHYEIATLILEYRMLAKLIGTYTHGLGSQINAKTGRVHTQFMLTGAQTGRFSSTEPNLQNIPIRTAEGREIRKAFISEDGYKLVSFDYSQIELRILAEVADIGTLKEAFLEGKDIHAMTASQVFKLRVDDVSPEARRQAKAINFGIIYGISSFGLARQLKCSRVEAQQFIDLYFKQFPGIRAYMDSTIKECEGCGYVRTLFGRRINISGINDKNATLRKYAQRQAINAPIQGSAADIIKRSMIRMPLVLEGANLSGVRMLLQVHDELIFEVPDGDLDLCVSVVSDAMESAHLPMCVMSVPLKVESGFGVNWYEAH